MNVKVLLASGFLAAVLMTGLPPAMLGGVETRHLIVSDATGRLSGDRLEALAEQAQTMLDRVVAFWSTDPRIDRFGKIRVIFDAPRRDFYSCVFYWEEEDGNRVRTVRVHGTEGTPQMMAHKLTSAVFPQKDKLIRNMMGILTEAQIGNPLTFPMCGFSSDDWVLALLRMKSYIPINELGPDHDSWGMRDAGGGKLQVFDRVKQHKAYAEAGSFADYLYQTFGLNKMKQMQRISQEKSRPWKEVFGLDLQDLEANWVKDLKVRESAREANVTIAVDLLERNPGSACAEAQERAAGKP